MDGRVLLTRILDVIVGKFESLVYFVKDMELGVISAAVDGAQCAQCECEVDDVEGEEEDEDEDGEMMVSSSGSSSSSSSSSDEEDVWFPSEITTSAAPSITSTSANSASSASSSSTTSSSSSSSSSSSYANTATTIHVTRHGSWRPEPGTPDWEWITLGLPPNGYCPKLRGASDKNDKKKKKKKMGERRRRRGIEVPVGYYSDRGTKWHYYPSSGSTKKIKKCSKCSERDSQPSPTSTSQSFHPTDSIKDVKSLIRTMMLGLKTVNWCLNNYRRPTTVAPGTSAVGSSESSGGGKTKKEREKDEKDERRRVEDKGLEMEERGEDDVSFYDIDI